MELHTGLTVFQTQNSYAHVVFGASICLKKLELVDKIQIIAEQGIFWALYYKNVRFTHFFGIKSDLELIWDPRLQPYLPYRQNCESSIF